MRTLSSSTALAIRVGAASLVVAPDDTRTRSYSLTAIGKITQLTATGAFSDLGLKLGDALRFARSRQAGLETRELVGMEYTPLTQRYWLSGDTSVNYMVACRRPQA